MSDGAKFQLRSPPVETQAKLPLPSGAGVGEGRGEGTLPSPPGRGAGGEGVSDSKPTRRKKDSVRLVWDSKPKRPPSPRDIEFQTAEVVIPNPARDAGQIPLSFRDGTLHNEGPDRSQMNRLVWGDNLLAMQALLASGYEGKIDLIYIDPPFDSKSDYTYQITIDGEEVTKEPSVFERLAYRDTWEAGTDSYLDMLYPRLSLMRRLLSERGVLFVHSDWHLNAPLRLLIDEVFGRDAFVNEIIWKRKRSTAWQSDSFGVTNDTILFYSKTGTHSFNPEHTKEDEQTQKYIAERFTHHDGDGRLYMKSPLVNPLPRPNLKYVFHGVEPPQTGWLYSKERMEAMYRKGELVMPSKPGARIYRKIFLDEYKGQPIQNIWLDIPIVNPMAIERLDFDTQKPEALLERIVKSCSSEGDLIADFFCGSGTTLAVAERLGRRWIGCDFGKVGIQVSRSRLVEMDATPFLLENIGNYQREMIYLSGGRIGEMQRIILKLYGATPHPQHRDLGTRQIDSAKNDLELVYVGYPDRPTTAKKVEELMRTAESLDGSGYKRLIILAWDYDYNFDAEWDARLKALKKKPDVDVQRRVIPPDVYDYLKKAKTEADIEKLVDKIHFHEKPYLKMAKPKVKLAKKDGESEATIAIQRYVIFDLPVPEKDREKLRELIKENFAVLIDYWAIDWNYDGATFRSQWQAIRGNGKRAKVVPTEVTHSLKLAKNQKIAIRVVDIFGNDAAAVIDLGASQ
ncbi:MAG: site-specific DNA-methyltransferase [Phycisphaerales bacterium]|nr:site-specific DNA-methyltransferase [Phycisphaerales bacterium]